MTNTFQTLGPEPALGQSYFLSVPRDVWFVRRLELEEGSESDFALIGCTVVPGYHDEDIETKTYGELKQEFKKS